MGNLKIFLFSNIPVFKKCNKNAPYYPYSKEDLYIDMYFTLCFHLIMDPITNKPKYLNI